MVVVMQMQTAFFGDQTRGLNMARTTGRNGGRVLSAGERDGRPDGDRGQEGRSVFAVIATRRVSDIHQ